MDGLLRASTSTGIGRGSGRSDVGYPARAPLNRLNLTRTPLIKHLERGWRLFGVKGHQAKSVSVWSMKLGVGNAEEESSWNWSCEQKSIVWEADRIARAVDGEMVKWGNPGRICTDSRKLKKGEWFLALRGPNFDGHEFLQEVLDRGCAGVIGQYVSLNWPRGFVRVDCSLQALHRLAAFVRKTYKGMVIGITGSAGKTTARAMTSLALESLGPIHQTAGNLNNHIGLPLTLLSLPTAASACVLEMGMSAPGEIQVLAAIAEPSVRVLLNVSCVHMENFKKLEDVALAKGELLSSAKPGDICVLNADDPLVMGLALPPKVNVIFFGKQEGCHVRLVEAHGTRGGRCVSVTLEQSIRGSVLTEKWSSGFQIWKDLNYVSTRSSVHAELDHRSRVDFEIPSPGVHLALNACAAATVAVALGIPLDIVSGSLVKFSPVGMRCKLEQVGDILLINDAYNSNPSSLESGLRSLSSIMCHGRKIAFLGDMLELGTISAGAHVDALRLCRELEVDFVGLVGTHFAQAAKSLDFHADSLIICRDCTELAGFVTEIVASGDVILVKGSRGMKMELIADAIKSGSVSS
ncbi:hypothetical protein R1flu_019884 [Riccia fluitans]|uniref:UDP-MurNAc-pentapeptide synthetase n=1 Tax=Riccia fluitans TaxID=41844 RepID=A0ABD1ZM43_9MARC